jgi:hypothetical protein
MTTVFKYAKKVEKFVGTKRFKEIKELAEKGKEAYEKGEEVTEGILKLHSYVELASRTSELSKDGKKKQIFREMSRFLAFTTAEMFDPTGVAALAASVSYPKCYKGKYYWINMDKYVE